MGVVTAEVYDESSHDDDDGTESVAKDVKVDPFHVEMSTAFVFFITVLLVIRGSVFVSNDVVIRFCNAELGALNWHK